MSQPTPGPWIASKPTGDTEPITWGHVDVEGGSGGLIATTWNDDDLANARLIAAAPELLEAAKAALAKLTDIERYGEHADNPLPVQLRTVIAKAEGRHHEGGD